MLNQIIQNTISQIESQRQREVEEAKKAVVRDKIVPFNTEIDNSMREAINELQAKHNERVIQLQQALDADKSALAEAATKKKTEFADYEINNAVAKINYDADKAIEKLRAMMKHGE